MGKKFSSPSENILAIDKLKTLIFNNSTCFLCTKPKSQPLMVNKMRTVKVDDNGNIWFMSSLNYFKSIGIEDNNQVRLLYSNPRNPEFLSIKGTASIHSDNIDIYEIWKHFAKPWFQGIKADPNIILIKITPKISYYWDIVNNKMIAMNQLLHLNDSENAINNSIESNKN